MILTGDGEQFRTCVGCGSMYVTEVDAQDEGYCSKHCAAGRTTWYGDDDEDEGGEA